MPAKSPTACSSAGSSNRRRLNPRPAAAPPNRRSTGCSARARPGWSVSARKASRWRRRHPRASFCARCLMTSSPSGTPIPRWHARGGWRCAPRWSMRSTRATASWARRSRAGTSWNASGPGPNRLSCVLQVGDRAPEFKLPTTAGQELTLAEALAQHKALVFLFYVLDFTGG
ncbi:redoxin domain-containing protein [bacterium]|nr:MAG: redoxin domain-containing protein [bacterium]